MCCLEDNINRTKLWNWNLRIRDNGTITIGSIIRFFKPKPHENVMPDGVPSIVTRIPVAVMRYHIEFMEVCVDKKVQGGESKGFCLNDCTVDIVSVEVEDAGCSERFCDK